MKYYIIAFKKNEFLPFVTIRMDLEGIRLNEIRQRKILYDLSNMWNPEKNLIYIERESERESARESSQI